VNMEKDACPYCGAIMDLTPPEEKTEE
jgi:hypothetical protein